MNSYEKKILSKKVSKCKKKDTNWRRLYIPRRTRHRKKNLGNSSKYYGIYFINPKLHNSIKRRMVIREFDYELKNF